MRDGAAGSDRAEEEGRGRVRETGERQREEDRGRRALLCIWQEGESGRQVEGGRERKATDREERARRKKATRLGPYGWARHWPRIAPWIALGIGLG